MNNENDWETSIRDIKVEKEEKEFKLKQLELKHIYTDTGDIYNGMPISTSIKLISKYNPELKKQEWKKVISHTYINLEKENQEETNTYDEELKDETIINKIENYDLRKLKNNYFTEESPEKFTYWELSYNYVFKIVGTYDQEINEVTNIKNILNFNNIIKEELAKIK